MTWNYVAGDNYDLKQLMGFHKFFLKDLRSAIESINEGRRYEKYGLPNWRTEMLRRQMGMEEAQQNLFTINKVIAVIERENK